MRYIDMTRKKILVKTPGYAEYKLHVLRVRGCLHLNINNRSISTYLGHIKGFKFVMTETWREIAGNPQVAYLTRLFCLNFHRQSRMWKDGCCLFDMNIVCNTSSISYKCDINVTWNSPILRSIFSCIANVTLRVRIVSKRTCEIAHV